MVSLPESNSGDFLYTSETLTPSNFDLQRWALRKKWSNCSSKAQRRAKRATSLMKIILYVYCCCYC